MEISTNFRLSGRKSQSQQKLAKKITYFTIQFCSKSFAHFTNLSSLNAIKNIATLATAKNMSLVGVRKNIRTTPFNPKKNCIFVAPANQMSVYSCESLFEAFIWWGLNIFLHVNRCLRLLKCFKIFYFNWNFWNFRCFLAFWYLHQLALKRWNFPENLGFNGNIVAKFLLRSHFLSLFIWQ